MSKISKQWAVLQFKPNSQSIAECNLNRQKFETFLPLIETTKCRNGKFNFTLRPLFPGYMFVSFNRTQTPLHKINCTYGVSKLLTLNNKPQLIPNSIVSSIRAQCNQKGVLLSPKQFSKGDSVTLVSGPFDNFLATVDNVDENQRIWVLINLMGHATLTLVKAEKLKYSIN